MLGGKVWDYGIVLLPSMHAPPGKRRPNWFQSFWLSCWVCSTGARMEPLEKEVSNLEPQSLSLNIWPLVHPSRKSARLSPFLFAYKLVRNQPKPTAIALAIVIGPHWSMLMHRSSTWPPGSGLSKPCRYVIYMHLQEERLGPFAWFSTLQCW